MANYPISRLRRLRQTSALRTLTREIHLSVDDLIFPLFIKHGEHIRHEVTSMPGIFQISIDQLENEIDELSQLGIKAVILFGIPEKKDELGTDNFDPDGIIQRAVKKIKQLNRDLVVITDVCMCEYTNHGHCGVIDNQKILNDPTLDILQKVSVSHAQSGVDIIAPSGMMDGAVQAIRQALDNADYQDIPIMSYSAKFASAFYGPFRDAAQGAPQFGDRSTYQMDYANRHEALREIKSDIDEGADLIIIKPATTYLDIIKSASDAFACVPLIAYNVSGEYSMIKAAVDKGWLNEKEIVLENLLAFKRAGARLIITYWAKQAAKWL